MFTLQSAGASLCTSNLGFMLKDGATLKEVQEQVARLACSQIHQKGDKSYYKELIFMLRKVNAGCMCDVIFFQTWRRVFGGIKVREQTTWRWLHVWRSFQSSGHWSPAGRPDSPELSGFMPVMDEFRVLWKQNGTTSGTKQDFPSIWSFSHEETTWRAAGSKAPWVWQQVKARLAWVSWEPNSSEGCLWGSGRITRGCSHCLQQMHTSSTAAPERGTTELSRPREGKWGSWCRTVPDQWGFRCK